MASKSYQAAKSAYSCCALPFWLRVMFSKLSLRNWRTRDGVKGTGATIDADLNAGCERAAACRSGFLTHDTVSTFWLCELFHCTPWLAIRYFGAKLTDPVVKVG